MLTLSLLDLNKAAKREADKHCPIRANGKGSELTLGINQGYREALDKVLVMLAQYDRLAHHKSECGFWQKSPCDCPLQGLRRRFYDIVVEDKPNKK